MRPKLPDQLRRGLPRVWERHVQLIPHCDSSPMARTPNLCDRRVEWHHALHYVDYGEWRIAPAFGVYGVDTTREQVVLPSPAIRWSFRTRAGRP